MGATTWRGASWRCTTFRTWMGLLRSLAGLLIDGGRLSEPGQHRVGDVADTGLQRQQPWWHPTGPHLQVKELDEMAGDRPRVLIDRLEGGVAVRSVGLHDGHDLLRRAPEVRNADAVFWTVDHHRPPVRRQGSAVVDVVHAVKLEGVAAIDLNDHLVGQVDPGLVVADRRRR